MIENMSGGAGTVVQLVGMYIGSVVKFVSTMASMAEDVFFFQNGGCLHFFCKHVFSSADAYFFWTPTGIRLRRVDGVDAKIVISGAWEKTSLSLTEWYD